ncbi:zinc finger protein 524 [Pleuronectes platessa]|uniref:zinc finger protein 524 n=1 Tax=Pleuronectes platessa TaxID=8262 RepID=UPI00232A5222|nr:zinc finger protein 524 [Pleuronectes platessa]
MDAVQTPHCCSARGNRFLTAGRLRAHVKVHASDRTHCCSICSKSFLRPGLLRKHMRIHIRDGLIAPPADQEFWSNMQTVQEEEEEEEKRGMKMEDEEEDGLDEQIRNDSGDRSAGAESFTWTSSRLPGPQENPDRSALREDDGDVSGLINSDGEEEEWRPPLTGSQLSRHITQILYSPLQLESQSLTSLLASYPTFLPSPPLSSVQNLIYSPHVLFSPSHVKGAVTR